MLEQFREAAHKALAEEDAGTTARFHVLHDLFRDGTVILHNVPVHRLVAAADAIQCKTAQLFLQRLHRLHLSLALQVQLFQCGIISEAERKLALKTQNLVLSAIDPFK